MTPTARAVGNVQADSIAIPLFWRLADVADDEDVPTPVGAKDDPPPTVLAKLYIMPAVGALEARKANFATEFLA